MKAVFALRGMTNTALVHLGKNSAEFPGIWEAESHLQEGAEIEMAVRVRGIGSKGHRSGKAFGREGVQEFGRLEFWIRASVMTHCDVGKVITSMEHALTEVILGDLLLC